MSLGASVSGGFVVVLHKGTLAPQRESIGVCVRAIVVI